jgi:protein-disulfide isomerase
MQFARIVALVLIGLLVITNSSARPEAQSQGTQQNDEVVKELRAIRQLLERLTPQVPAPTPARHTATMTNLAGYVLGKRNAPLTIVEFTDLQCPFCRQFSITTFLELKEKWVDTGKAQYILKDLPLEFHPYAMDAARATRCSADQGKFWEMRLALVQNATRWSADSIAKAGAGIGLDVPHLTSCVASRKHDEDIHADIAEAKKIGVTGTPAFVIGRTTSKSEFEGVLIVGAAPYSVFDAQLSQILALNDK